MTPQTAVVSGARFVFTATGVSISDHLYGLAGILLTGALGVSATVAPSVYRDWRASRRTPRDVDHDVERGDELHDLAEHNREEMAALRRELSEARQDLSDERAENRRLRRQHGS